MLLLMIGREAHGSTHVGAFFIPKYKEEML